MTVDSIKNGIVIDHITAGNGMQLYRLLGLDELDCTVAIMKNVQSRKMGRKDIIKIDAFLAVDLDVIGFVDPKATVNIIRDGKLAEKKTIQMPATITGVARCKNPRCITSTEPNLPQVFCLTDPANKVYRCRYCEAKLGG